MSSETTLAEPDDPDVEIEEDVELDTERELEFILQKRKGEV
jgi:hypothetical protein